jgi:hypothetical protein
VLLSDEKFTQFAKDRLVLSWENIREPVKVVHDGEHRTLGGNTVMYVVSPQGFVADAFPGVYLPDDLMPSLEAAADLAMKPTSEWKGYHRQRTSFAISARVNASKAMVESSLLDARGAGDIFERETPAGVIDLSHVASNREETRARLGIPADLDDDRAMQFAIQLDSRANMTSLRPKVHEFLQDGIWTPDEIKNTMFKDFLGVPIDDPALGIR